MFSLKFWKDNPLVLKCVIVAVIFLFVFLLKQFQGSTVVHDFFAKVESFGYLAFLIFIALYVLMSGILMPSIVFKVASGALFGVLGGVVVVSIASVISSTIKFILARYFFRESILKRIESNDKLMAIDKLIEEDGWKMLIILRNVPVVNSMFLNYICAVTKMRLSDFALASFVGRLPTTLMYAYLGYVFGYKIAIEGQTPIHMTFEWAMLALGCIATIGATYYAYYLSKRVIAQRIPQTS